LSVVSKMI